MRTLLIMLIVVAMCRGNHLNMRKLMDYLRTQEAAESKRHGFPPEAKRQETTQQRTTPDTYVETTTSVPEKEIDGYDEAFLFPGSHFLTDMIRNHCESGMGLQISVDDIVDYFEIPECDMKDIGDVFGLLGRIKDTDGIAILATRMIIKPMLAVRMKCPASILEMGLTKLLLAKKQHFISDDDEALYIFLKKMAPMVDTALEPFADDIAMKGALEIHETIFRDTLDFLLQFGYKDLGYGSHQISQELQNYFQHVLNGIDNSDQLKMGLESAFAGIKCPSTCEVVKGHIREIQRFKDVFTTMETEHICLKVIGFLSNYINMAIPGHQPEFRNNEALETVCQGIKFVIAKSVEEYSKYEYFLSTADISEFSSIAENVLPQEQWTLLEEAANRLGLQDKSSLSCLE